MKSQRQYSEILKRFVYRYTVHTIVIVIFMAILLYALLHFGVSMNVTYKIENDMLRGIDNEVENEMVHMNDHLKEVVHLVVLLKNVYTEIFLNYDKYDTAYFDGYFAIHKNGAYYKEVDNGGASLYYSSSTPLTDYAKEKALKTEWADPIMKNIVDNDELITQAYLNTFDDMNRIYPFIPDLPSQFGPTLDMDVYNFYYLADDIHNPDRQPVWTKPYLDPAGQGWMISAIAPVYNNNFLEGVVGLDITLDVLIGHSLEDNKLNDSALLLIDDKGLIVAMNKNAQLLLKLDELGDDNYQNIQETILKPEAFNIASLTDENLRSSLSSILESDVSNISHNDQAYYVNKRLVDQTKWTLMAITPESYIGRYIDQINNSSIRNFLVIIIAVMVLLVLIIMVYKKRIHVMALSVSEPLKQMAMSARDFSVDKGYVSAVGMTGISEIDILNKEIRHMSDEITNRTNKLIRAQMENQKAVETIEVYHKRAITDELTQLYNRRRADDVIDAEIRRAERYASVFSLILLDVDYFKEINDQYGHQTGDEILKDVAEILRKNVRNSDVVSRWGGDEFLIIVIEANEDLAFKLGEKIRISIHDALMYNDIRVTSSIGVASYQMNDDARDLLRKTDQALYEAKHLGKNKVVQYRKIGVKNGRQ